MRTQSINSSRNLIFALLSSRLVLFLVFQGVIALLTNSWHKSEKYWLVSATLTNIVSIIFLFFLFRREGQSFFHLFQISKLDFKKDIFIFLALAVLSVPIVITPGYLLSTFLWNDPNVPNEMMFGAIEKGMVYILLFAFPISIGLAELATYFGYIMPKLKTQLKPKYLAIIFPVFFLAIQHCTLPFIPDFHFVLYRALVFLPFAILIGVSIYYRPTLFLYFAVLHTIMDFGTAYLFLLEIK